MKESQRNNQNTSNKTEIKNKNVAKSWAIKTIRNRLDFKRHLGKIPIPISNCNQNLFSRFHSLYWIVVQKVISKDQVILGYFMQKNQVIWLAERNMGQKLKN